jgi:hypothetical protein
MEKCTYCIQRIRPRDQGAQRRPQDPRRRHHAGLRPDLPDQGHHLRGSQRSGQPGPAGCARTRAYAMLAELNVKPRTFYWPRIRKVPKSAGADGPGTTGTASRGGHGHDDGGHGTRIRRASSRVSHDVLRTSLKHLGPDPGTTCRRPHPGDRCAAGPRRQRLTTVTDSVCGIPDVQDPPGAWYVAFTFSRPAARHPGR